MNECGVDVIDDDSSDAVVVNDDGGSGNDDDDYDDKITMIFRILYKTAIVNNGMKTLDVNTSSSSMVREQKKRSKS